MKDRIPTYPNRVQLIPVEGQEGYFDIVRADEPIEQGTPLNKATLLSDTTAKVIGLEAQNPTPDAAFLYLGTKPFDNSGFASDFWLYITGKHPILNNVLGYDYAFTRVARTITLELTGDAQTVNFDIYDNSF